MRKLLGCAAIVLAVSVALAQEGEKSAVVEGDGLHPRVKIETSLGDIMLELDAEKAPCTVANFVKYVEGGYYTDTIFHRVMAAFMIQGGGYTAEMAEKAGLRPAIRNEWKNGLKNKRGTISMARVGGNPDSATSQFFINVVDNDRLDQPQPDGAAYCVFGRVIEGMETVDKIKDTPVITHAKLPMGKVVPETPIVIKSVTVAGGCNKEKIGAAAAAADEAVRKAVADANAAKEKEVSELVTKIEAETKGKVEKHESGLMYVVLKGGEGDSPAATDTVQVHYTGWLVDGTKFDSSVDRGQPAEFPLNRVIKGWTVGVGLMKVGEMRKLIIPPEMGYGQRGAPPRIPANAWLVFDVELLSIKK
ncbi:MAG: hypothetical protein CHACPFDD_00846 [Phycisphaerae bacterium]|nr:hypothetical protein [Phycisphaerae bacterium]